MTSGGGAFSENPAKVTAQDGGGCQHPSGQSTSNPGRADIGSGEEEAANGRRARFSKKAGVAASPSTHPA
jgi:hypothetical protein